MLAWAGESTQSEWVEGEAVIFLPPKTVHALVSGSLFNRLTLYVDLLALGRVIAAPFEMRLARSAREPDLLFIATADLDRLTPERFLGAVDLVVELVADDGVGRDRVAKLAEDGAAGVPEYWLLDPRPGMRRADVFLPNADGRSRPAELDANGRFHSRALPGFWLDPVWRWQDPPPPLALMTRIAPDVLHVLRAAVRAGGAG